MAKLLVALLAILLVSLSEAKSVFPTFLKVNNEKTLDVFKINLPTKINKVNESEYGSPKPLLIIEPFPAGQKYPVVLFLHGTCLENSFYSDILVHIASHGYIVVAPQIYTCTTFGSVTMKTVDGQKEVDLATEVANWLPKGLPKALKGRIMVDQDRLIIAGHSNGGKTAFAIQLGHSSQTLTTKFSALVGLDPVAGTSKEERTDPKILTYVPHSFNLTIPVTVIGTGLGKFKESSPCCFDSVCSACAAEGVNHDEFYKECRAPASHFVVTEYGHMDVLNDDLKGPMGDMAKKMCKNSKGKKDPMRKTVGGVIVAFLKANFFKGKDFNTILENPHVAPATLCPVESKEPQYLAQV